MEIEVFRAGNAAANAAGITAADLADVAAFDCTANPVPNVIGHPKSDSPAHGKVVKFRAEGNSLFADVDEKLPAFAKVVEGIKGSTILGRSMAFFGKNHPSNPTPGKLAPKHLGFLGGAAVGIPGMPPLAQAFAFSADGDELEVTGDPAPAVVFEAAPTAVITFTEQPDTPGAAQEPNVAELTEAEKALNTRIEQFEAREKAARERGNSATVDALVAGGQVSPDDGKDLVAAFNAIDDANRAPGDVIAFASDANKEKASPVAIISAIMAKSGKVVPLGQDPHTPTGDAPEFSAGGDAKAEAEAARAERMKRYGN